MLVYLLTLIEEESDKEFFTSLFENYKKQMHTSAKKVLKDDYLAEDAVQNAFVSVIKHLDKLRKMDEKAVKRYLLVSSKNSAIDLIKKEICVDTVYETTEDLAKDEIYSVTEQAFIDYILNELPTKYRDIMYYHFILGIPEMEISQMLEMNINTVRQQVSRGRKKFIENYKKEMSELC